MSSINLTRKESCTSTWNFTASENYNQNNPPIISIILTESIANELDIKAKSLQKSDVSTNKSKICLYIETPPRRLSNKSTFSLSDDCAFYRIVDMDESSTSIPGMDDLSEVNIYLEQQNENETTKNILYLGPCIVHTKSLLTVSSIAHDNKLFMEANKLFIKGPINSQNWVSKCRICYGSISNEELIRPCKCKGSVACAHLSCLEHWLRESGRSYCELCKHNFKVVRTPKYGLLKSIAVWLSSPGEHAPVLIEDLISFSLYTPAAVCSTYILILLSDNALRNAAETSGHTANLITFFAFAGIAAIDFTYSSWLMMCIQKHIHAWRMWYRENCCLTLILPPKKPNGSTSTCTTNTNED